MRDQYILFAFLCGPIVALCGPGTIFSPEPSGFSRLLEDRSGVGAGELLAMAALFTVAWRVRGEIVLSRWDYSALALSSLCFAVPFRSAAIAPMALIGLMFARKSDLRLASIGQVLLALVFYEWIGHFIFLFVAPVALTAEAMAAQALLSLTGNFSRDGLELIGANGHAVAIETGCSAFHSLSLATLIWISLLKFQTLDLRRGHWLILAAMAAATVALNTVRITLMLQSREMFDYWHGGGGVPYISAAMLAAALAVFLLMQPRFARG